MTEIVTGEVSQIIRRKRERLAELDREREALLAELDEWRRLLGAVPDRRKTKRETKRRPIRDRSTVWWAVKVLKHEHRPMPVDALVQAISELSGLTVRKSTLVSNLSRYVQANDTFIRPEPGVYGLADEDGVAAE